MSKILYKMPARYQGAIDLAIEALQDFLAIQEDARENASEKWLSSDRAKQHDEWVSEIGDYAEHLQECPREA